MSILRTVLMASGLRQGVCLAEQHCRGLWLAAAMAAGSAALSDL